MKEHPTMLEAKNLEPLRTSQGHYVFYHFTSPYHVIGCRREGLWLGAVPYLDNRGISYDFHYNMQWLTTNPDWNQSWARGSDRLPYHRNAFRLTVRIPRRHGFAVSRWLNCKDKMYGDGTREILNAYGDPENWFLCEGLVRPAWIIAVDENPANTVQPVDLINRKTSRLLNDALTRKIKPLSEWREAPE